MANFVLLYSGGSMPATEAEQATVLQAWGAWYERLGSAVVDGGNPVKGFHLTNGWRPDAAKRFIMACQGVVQHGRRPDANALHDTSHRGRAFTIHVRAALMP